MCPPKLVGWLYKAEWLASKQDSGCELGHNSIFLLSQMGWTPIMEASSRGCTEAARVLLEKGANPNAANFVSL